MVHILNSFSLDMHYLTNFDYNEYNSPAYYVLQNKWSNKNVFFNCDILLITDTLDFDLSLFVRHRRSYAEQHRKSKEAMLSIGNAVKSAAHGAKSTVFITDNCTVVVTQTGGTATLPCVVRKFSNGVVSFSDIPS